MQKGKNVTELGDRLDEIMTQLRLLLPPDINVDIIADQPTMVRERIAELGHEFLLAIGAVILVTIILLPIRVALIAALAIPVTLLATVGIMNAFGIPLHQVSIAALIVVLGIVVDNAIVIVDNYVELLDHKVPRAEATWRSAAGCPVPVFAATVTIVCSFMPLIILTGTAGEFIIALPLTVSIALVVSFIVAITLTPFLCSLFIKKGLHDHEAPGKKKSFNLLDSLQNVYGKAIVFLMKRKGLGLALGVGAVVLGAIAFQLVPQQFFPPAERNQFVIDRLDAPGHADRDNGCRHGPDRKVSVRSSRSCPLREFCRAERPEILLQRQPAAARWRLRPVHCQHPIRQSDACLRGGPASEIGCCRSRGHGDRQGTAAGIVTGGPHRNPDFG